MTMSMGGQRLRRTVSSRCARSPWAIAATLALTCLVVGLNAPGAAAIELGKPTAIGSDTRGGAQMAAGPDGEVYVAWVTVTSGKDAVELASREPSGVWSTKSVLEASEGSVGGLALAVAGTGEPVLSWQRGEDVSEHQVEEAIEVVAPHLSGPPGSPTVLDSVTSANPCSSDCESLGDNVLAGGDGRATAAWIVYDYQSEDNESGEAAHTTAQVMTSQRVEGQWGTPVVIQEGTEESRGFHEGEARPREEEEAAEEDFTAVSRSTTLPNGKLSLAMSSSGATLLGWTTVDSSSCQQHLVWGSQRFATNCVKKGKLRGESVYEQSGHAAVWTAATALSGSWTLSEVDPTAEAGTAEAGAPHVAVSSSGAAGVSWCSARGGEGYLEVAQRPSTGSWGAPETVSAGCGSALSQFGELQRSLAFSGNNELLAAEVSAEANCASFRLWSANAPNTWRSVVSSSSSDCAELEDLAAGPTGEAGLIWGRGARPRGVFLDLRRSSGTWLEPLQIAQIASTGEADPEVAFLPDGNAIVLTYSNSEAQLNARLLNVAPTLAAVTTGPASSVAASTTRISGAVTPNGEASACKFEYGTSTSYGTSVPCEPAAGEGFLPVSVTGTLAELTPDTTYHYRIVASNAAGTSYGEDQTFQTVVRVLTGPASEIAQTEAQLTGTVDPLGETTSCAFEYGPTTGYGSNVPCETAPGSVVGAVPVAAKLTGLAANTVYHYRLTANSAAGTFYGDDAEVKTLPEKPTVAVSQGQGWPASIRLRGTVNPNGGALSECSFEYGPSTAYGHTTACTPDVIGSEVTSPIPVQATVTGLASDTPFHFRVTARNPAGTSYSLDGTTVTTSSIAIPEIGACVKLKTPTGRYTDKACTVKSAGGDTGDYEWEPWGVSAESDFSSDVVPAKIESAGSRTISCTKSQLVGEYTGEQAAQVSLVLQGCSGSGALSGSCSSPGAGSGTITATALDGTLGLISGGSSPSTGLELSSASDTLAAFDCGTTGMELLGSVIGELTADKTSTTQKLDFKGKAGKQSPEAFAEGVKQTLSLVSAGHDEAASLKASYSWTGPKLEFKAKA